jgi:hypothetical protein
MKSALTSFFALMLPLADGRAAVTSDTDAAWIARCVAQVSDAHDAASKRRYCTCMHGYFEDNEKVTQSEMERMFPPAHRLCHAQAGWD